MGTDGGQRGTSGERIAVAVIAGAVLVIAALDALTVADDRAALGRPLDVYEPWVWELTSAAFWLAAAVPLLRVARRWSPPAVRWPLAIGALVLLSVPVCAAHVAWLAGTRAAIYALFGARYRFDFAATQLVYEWRKDVLTVLGFAAVGHIAARLTAPPAAAAPATVAPFRLAVRDGTRTRHFAAAEIERVEAAGNYVELHTARGVVLHRATLAAVAADLAAHGFARIHRSRLIRRDAVTDVATTASGDFAVTLASGAVVAGSRRFRGEL